MKQSPRISRRVTHAFLCGAIAVSAFGVSAMAEAKDRRLNGGTCESGNDETDRWNSGHYWNKEGNNASVYCNIPNDSYFRQSETADLRVGAYRPNNGATMQAKACIQFYNGSGSACGVGTTFNVGTTPSQSIFDLSQWSIDFHGAFVFFQLPDNARIYNMYWHD